MLQPGCRTGIAFGVDLLYPITHLVIDERDGIPERIDAAREELIFVPLVAPVFTAFINVADDQTLHIPVVQSRLAIVVFDCRQPGV